MNIAFWALMITSAILGSITLFPSVRFRQGAMMWLIVAMMMTLAGTLIVRG